MPVRSSICTYSPSTINNSKYSVNIIPSHSPLSIGNYKPLSSYGSSTTTSSTAPYKSSHSSYASGPATTTTSSSRLGRHYGASSNHLSSPSYSSYSSLHSGSHSSLSSTSSASSASFSSASSSSSSSGYSPTTTSHYKPRSSAHFNRHDSGDSWTLRRGSLSTSTTTSASAARTASEPLPSGVPHGLVNLGNTCYMNASIQSLYAIETFRNLILRSTHDKVLTSELSDLFKSLKNSTASISPSNFKYAFSRYQQKFSGFGQQDAQEFLRYLINGIHEELNQASRRPRRSVPPRPPKTADEAWSQYTDIVDDSPLVNIVVGQMCSTVICSTCHHKSHCWDPFWDLSLPLQRSRLPVRLSQLIQDFTAQETLDSDERPICSECKKPTRSTKQIELCRLPKLMILHLKKFSNDGYKLSSPEVKVDKTLTFNGTTYYLKACINHHGHSSSSGHYTSHCEYSSRWFHFNDDRVRDVTNTFDSSKLDDAYVLFYTQSQPRASFSQSKL